MNWKIVSLAAAFTVTSAHAALIGDWRQNELSGLLIDSTGGHPDGVPTGTPTYGMPGVPNGTYGSITVTGATGTSIGYGPSDIDEYFTIGSTNINPVLNLDPSGSFTVMGWMQPLMSNLAGRTYRIIAGGTAGGADGSWGFGLRLNNLDGTGSALRFTGFGVADRDGSLFNVTYGSWIHAAVTYSNGALSYFLNGDPVGTNSTLFNADTANARLIIGARFGGNDVDQMNGQLDGVRVYDTVLTQAEIQQAAVQSVVPEPGAGLLALVAGAGVATRRRRQLS